jgi:hypothetical protein
MVYHSVKIHSLTPSQKSNLMKGKAVRMCPGAHHTIPMREDQVKKLHRNASKNMMTTIALDDGALSHLHGTGFFDSLKSIAKVAAPILRPIATNALKGVASSMLGPIGSQVAHGLLDVGSDAMASKGYGIKKRAGRPRKYVHHDKRLVNGMIVEPVARGKKLRSVKGKGWGMDLLKGASKALRPVATNLIQSQLAARGGPLTNALGGVALQALNNAAESHGYGLHKKKRGRPSKKGGALIAAGY